MESKDMSGEYAFQFLFGEKFQSFENIFDNNIDQLKKQLDKEEFHECDSKACLVVLKKQFETFFDPKSPLSYSYQYQSNLVCQKENFKEIDERACHEEELRIKEQNVKERRNDVKRLNEIELQIHESMMNVGSILDDNLDVIKQQGKSSSPGNDTDSEGAQISKNGLDDDITIAKSYHDNDKTELQAKNKDLENVVCNMGKSTKTLRLLTNEQRAYQDNICKSGLGYKGPCVLSQANAKIPKLYSAYELHDENVQLHVFDSEETLEDAEKNRLKMKEFQKDEKFPVEVNDIIDVFVSMESDLDGTLKQNELLKDRLMEVTLAEDVKNLDRGFRSLPNSTKANPRDQVKSISTTIKADSCPIRRIRPTQYAVSTGQNRTLMYETRQMTILFPCCLNGYCCEEKKGLYGPQFLKAYSEASQSIPQKDKDPGSFTLNCLINNVCFNNVLVDLGSSVSVMPLSTYLNLGLGELAHTKLTIELADRTVKYSKGIAENVLVSIGKFTFHVEFIILDMPEDIKVPLILRRPFLSTARAKIDFYKRKITLRVGEERIVFISVKPASSLIKRVYMLSLRERMELDLEARLMGENLLLNRSLDPFLEDYIELNDLNELFELRRNQGDDLMPIIEEGEDLGSKEISTNIGGEFTNLEDLEVLES
ncbi:retrovirus-related pol polyprotein from transposon TNT 1-94 [Tanacetum coccineum]|uniref:Retrovirus-related pol polyprotein from transposon TNT 1-94 n=1 Tax=Tanacetum coccineum TaxID=301880 RepID=A0ABQ5CHD6_9ASTR